MISTVHHHNGPQQPMSVAILTRNSFKSTITPSNGSYNQLFNRHERNYSYIEAMKDGEERLKLIDVFDNMQSLPLPPKPANYVKSLTICNSAIANSKPNGYHVKTTHTPKPKVSETPNCAPEPTLLKSHSQSSILNLFKTHFTSPFLNRKFRSKSKENHKVTKTATTKTSKTAEIYKNPPVSNRSQTLPDQKTSLTIKLTSELANQCPSLSPDSTNSACISNSSVLSLLKTNESSIKPLNDPSLNSSPSSVLNVLKLNEIDRQTSHSKTTNNTAFSSPKTVRSPRQQSSLHLACLINGYDISTTRCLLQTKQKLNDLKISDLECTTVRHTNQSQSSTNIQQPKVTVKVSNVL
jgi:hypothetical protein